MELLDGTGSGRKAGVDIENRLQTTSVSQSIEHHNNKEFGRAFSLLFQQTATGAGDYIFYAKNTGSRDLILEGYNYRVASAEQLLFYINPEGDPVGGTEVVPGNLNGGSARLLTGTYQAGNDITGLTNGTLLYRDFLTSTETDNKNFEADLVLPQGSSIAIVAVTGGVQVDISIVAFESDL